MTWHGAHSCWSKYLLYRKPHLWVTSVYICNPWVPTKIAPAFEPFAHEKSNVRILFVVNVRYECPGFRPRLYLSGRRKKKKISSVLSPQHAGNQQASFQEVLEAVPGLVSHALTIVARSGKWTTLWTYGGNRPLVWLLLCQVPMLNFIIVLRRMKVMIRWD